MGYRLEISNIKTDYYGTKLYGYGIPLETLKSYQYLCSLGKITGEEYWGYGSDIYIILNADEFREFIKLYNEDVYNNPVWIKYEKDDFINLPEIQELLKNNNQKLLQWN